jgi:hypothetical protein
MNIDTILSKWEKAKQQKLKYEKECELYKDAVQRYMDKKSKNTVDGEYYTVTRRSNTRQQLSKQNVPPEIWNKYATRITYMSYHFNEK